MRQKFIIEKRGVHFGLLNKGRPWGLRRISYEKWPAHRTIENHIKVELVLFCLAKGKAVVDIGTGKQEVRVGDCFFLSKNSPHYFKIYDKECKIYRIAFSGNNIFRDVKKYLGEPKKIFHPAQPNEVFETFQKLLDEAHSMRPFRLKMLEKLVPVLLTTVRRNHSESNSSRDPSNRLWQQAKNWIEKAEPSKASVAELARACHCSSEHLSRVFKKHSDTTPFECLFQRKMNRASNLLTNSDKTLRDIALTCGYGDEFIFSKAFKKHFGEPPGRWRKQAYQS